MARAASPADGFWRTAEGDGLVSVRACGESLCGYLIDRDKLQAAGSSAIRAVRAGESRPATETVLLNGFTGGPERWAGGRIINPENGKVYRGWLRLLSRDRLKVTGCLVRPLCGSQVWTRTAPP